MHRGARLIPPIRGCKLTVEEVAFPSYKDFRQLQLQSLGQDYSEQTTLLDKLHENSGEDVFVATFSVVQSPEGELFSYATWTETTNSLLPKTDVLVLGRLRWWNGRGYWKSWAT